MLNKSQPKHNPSYFVRGHRNIADAFNDYFVNIGSNIANQLPTTDTSFESFLNDRCPNYFFITPIIQEEIVDIINKIPCGKAPGWDGVSSIILNKTKYYFAKPLALIFNKSITSGIFPDGLKVGKVVTIYEKGSKNEIRNYRPITVLSVFSKVFEKLIFNRLISFVDNNGVLSDSQFGFRKNRSTEMAKVQKYLVQQRIRNILDLSKAFDTANHDILIRKLDQYGIRGIALDWFKIYLCNRKQFVCYNTAISMDQYI